MNEYDYLVANMDTLIDIDTSKEEKWLRHWNESCDAMTDKYEKINSSQPVVSRKATKEEIEKWTADIKRKNPFQIGVSNGYNDKNNY